MSPKFSPQSESAKLHSEQQLRQKLQVLVNFFNTDIDKQKAPLPPPPSPPGGPQWWKQYQILLAAVVEATEALKRTIEL